MLRRMPGLPFAVFVAVTAAVFAERTAGLQAASGRRPVQLWPPDESPDAEAAQSSIDLFGWNYRAVRARVARDGVPWELIASPAGELQNIYRKGDPNQPLPFLVAERRQADQATTNPDAIPVIELPDALWKKWLSQEMQDVVGIHDHELVTDDAAHILYTLHKVPADNPDGSEPGPASPTVDTATRIEATLLAPVTYGLDQTILVRGDPSDPSRARVRGDHEAGHAQLSQQVLLAVLKGPQDWDLGPCVGRRSQLEFYWKREQIGRSWSEYRRGVGKVLALRTSITLVPPTRWSLLLPIPPERVTQKHLQQFTDAIVMIGEQFAAADREAQRRFHAEHGAFETAGVP
jgi:hypothetical protein